MISSQRTDSSASSSAALSGRPSQSDAGVGLEAREPIAVVGVGCRFPGGADSPDAYWRLLRDGVDAITQTPKDRWDLEAFYRPGAAVPGRTQSRWGGYLSDIDRFDPALFGHSPREAAAMDPQQRLLLEVAYRAMEDAGQPVEGLSGRPVSVFTGISSIDYAVAGLSFQDRTVIGPYSNTGSSSSIAANRISYCFDLRGPSVAVDTACSSSLVALHMACESLWQGEAEWSLAGGVNALLLPDFYIAFSQLGVLSPDGRCKTFDARANGYARSEGAGMVLLKPLSQARADGDRIYCLIRATALNQDGRTPGLTVPSGDQQERLVRLACARAGVQPQQVGYVEAHGTGTSVGDPIEARALGRAFGRHRQDACRIGSVKTNIGHLEAGAGIASLIKVALSLHHESIPPHLHLQQPHPEIDLEGWNLEVPTQLQPWPAEGPVRIAGINGFGYGGTNGHLVVSEAPRDADVGLQEGGSSHNGRHAETPERLTIRRGRNGTRVGTEMPHVNGNGAAKVVTDPQASPAAELLTLSATDSRSLAAVAGQWIEWLQEHPDADPHQLAATAAHHRSHLDTRTAIVGRSRSQWLQRLRELVDRLRPAAVPAADSEAAADDAVSAVADGASGSAERPRGAEPVHVGTRLPAAARRPGVLFLCCGQGPQWWAMGRGLYRDNPAARAMLEQIDAEFRLHETDWQLLEELHRDEEGSRMNRTSIAQPALFAVQVAQAAAWQSVGVRPSVIIGHSVGEIAAAHLSGGLDFADACQVAIHRGRTMDLATSRGAMIAVGVSEDEALQRIEQLASEHPGLDQKVSVAAVNGPQSITLSGDAEAIERLAVSVEADHLFCRRLAVEYAFHSPQMDPVRDELLRSLRSVQTRPLHTPMISTVTGRYVDENLSLGGDYWWSNVRQGVRFADAVTLAARDGYRVAVELGPHPVLTFATTECYGQVGEPVQTIASARRPRPDRLANVTNPSASASRSEEADSTGALTDRDQEVWLEAVGRLHSFGFSIDWSGVYPVPKPRADLPRYPMQRESLWLESFDSQQSRLPKRPHPLLGMAVDGTDPFYQNRLDPKTHAFLLDHRVRNASMFPAAAGVEMVAAAAARYQDQQAREENQDATNLVRLHRFQLLAPLVLDARRPHQLQTRLHEGRGQWDLSFREQDADDWTTLARVTQRTAQDMSADKLVLRWKAAQDSCRDRFRDQDCYDYCESIGLNYDASFRGVRGGVRRDGESICEVQLPSVVADEAFRHDAAQFTIHPAVLDSCFHAMVVCDPAFGGPPGGLYLPHEIEEIQFDLSALHCDAKRQGATESEPGPTGTTEPVDGKSIPGVDFPILAHACIRMKDEHRLVADITLLHRDGRPIGWLKGFESRRLRQETASSTADLMYRYQWQPEQDEQPTDSAVQAAFGSEHVVVFAPETLDNESLRQTFGVAEKLSIVRPAGSEATADFTVDPDDVESFTKLWRGLGVPEQPSGGPELHLIYLWGLQAPSSDQMESWSAEEASRRLTESVLWTTRAPLHLVQSWEGFDAAGARLTIVTRDAQSADELDAPVEVTQTPLIGIGRVIISELTSLDARLVDVASDDPDWLTADKFVWLADDREDEVMWRSQRRWVHRFVPDSDRMLRTDKRPSDGDISDRDPGESPPQYRLAKGRASGVADLVHQAIARQPLGHHDVEIRVAGAGLNFSDVMKVLDLYPGLPPGPVQLGAEVSGVVTRIGRDVRDFQVGDAVVAVAPGGFASHVVVRDALTAPAPRNIDLVDASAIPVAWLTADHAIHTCARMRSGESLLVHSASGGVGLAALDIARAAGVEVFATAGNPTKRDFVRQKGVDHVFNSRSLDFAQQVRSATAGRETSGVDAVLNSLPGEAIPAGLSLLKTGGRFLEIGKRDIYDDGSLGLYAFRNNLAFFAIDLDQLFKQQPVAMGARLRELIRQIDTQAYRPETPKRFAAEDASAAFRFMQAAKHIGKVVVDYTTAPTEIRSRDDDEVRFRSDATYWLAGGLGGFGLRIARWMAENGAGTLVLSGRRARPSDEAQLAIEAMQAAGTNVVTMPCDITNIESVQKTVAKIQSELPPLRGVVHTAMVLEDRLLADLDRTTLERVLWPKVSGGWNLHRATRQLSLDHFILFSSLSSVFGHAGQGNYSAANAYLDGLAHHRRQLGLPSMVINWGHLGEVGYLARRQELSERLRRQGVLDFSAGEATSCLGRAINRQLTQCSVLRMDWTRWRGLGLTKDVSPRFAHLIRGTGAEASVALDAETLTATPAAQRPALLRDAVGIKLASLLGSSASDLDADRPMLELGLDSLMAVELRNWIEGQLGLKLQIGTLMRGGSLNTLVEALLESTATMLARAATGDALAEPASTSGSGAGDSGRPARRGVAARDSAVSDDEPSIGLASIDGNNGSDVDDPEMADRTHFPMSDQQTGLWYSYRRNPAGTSFNVFLPSRLRSRLDVEALKAALNWVVQRHACLRTTFSGDEDRLTQTVHEELAPEITMVDLSDAASGGELNETELRQAVMDETQRPFDLENGPLLRLRLFKIADDNWVAVATTHHIVVDFWSLILILSELRQVYPQCMVGSPPPVTAPPRDYFDFVASQRKLLHSTRGRRLQQYWTRTLADVPTVLEVPTDRTRPATFTGRASVVPIQCPLDVGHGVNELAMQMQTTSAAVVLAGLQVFLQRLTRQNRFVIGSPFAGRTQADLEETVGFFVNMLPLVADLTGQPSFSQLIRRAGNRLVDSMQNEEYPFSQIVRDIDPPRDTGRSPLIQVSCTFEKAHVREEEGRAGYLFPAAVTAKEVGGLRQESYYIPHQTCHYDLEFIFEQTGDRLNGMVVYNHDLYDEDTMRRYSELFVALIGELIRSPYEDIRQVTWPEEFHPAAAGESSRSLRPAVRPPIDPCHASLPPANDHRQAGTLSDLLRRSFHSSAASTAIWGVEPAEMVGGVLIEPDGFRRSGDQRSERSTGPDDASAGQSLSRFRRRTFYNPQKPKPASPSLGDDSVSLMDAVSEKGVGEHVAKISTSAQHCQYGGLDQLTEVLAQALTRRGVQIDDLVPVAGRPGPRTTTLILAVMRCGAVPIPIDTGKASVMSEALIRETAASHVVVDEPSLWSDEIQVNVWDWQTLMKDGAAGSKRTTAPGSGDWVERQPSDLAYVIYTSGTTGTPKGVMIPHRGIHNTMVWRQRVTPLGKDDRMFMPLSHQFDAGLGMTLLALTSGASVVWPRSANTADIDAVVQQLIDDRISVLVGVPSWIDLVASHPRFAECRDLRYIWVGGESMPESLPRLIRRSSEAQIWNCYGPTEASVESTAYRIDDIQCPRRIPVGLPADHTGVAIVDSQHRLQPRGVVGEIVLTGAGLAVGYLNRDDLTREKFVTLEDGRRGYLTGDQGRLRIDGLVEVIGRIDRQIKLGGYRIEPVEIETVLRDHASVAVAAVVAQRLTESGDPALVAFVQLETPGEQDSAPAVSVQETLVALRHHLAEHLPPYKRPRRIEIVPRLECTASGKVDFSRLPTLSTVSDGEMIALDADALTPPSTALERHLADLWGEMLGTEQIGVSRNFFELGGSSLQAATLTNRLSDDLGVNVPTSLLFDLADISSMAQRLVQLYPAELMARFGEQSVRFYDSEIAGSRRRAGVEELVAPLKITGGRTPLFMIHPPGGIVVCYRELAAALPDDQPLYAIRSRGLHGRESLPESIEAMAAEYVEAIRSVQPHGPFVIGGWSIGGVIATEVARQWIAQGETVERLILLDTAIPSGSSDLVPAEDQTNVGLEYGIDMTLDELIELKPEQQLPFLWQHAQKMGLLDDGTSPEVAARAIEDLKHLFHHHVDCTRRHRLQPIDADVLLVRPSEVPVDTGGSFDRGWSHLAKSVEVVKTPGHHHSMVQSPNVLALADAIAAAIRQRQTDDALA